MSELKPKPYYRIGEVARHLGVQTHVLRYWESEFPHLGPTRAPSGHRLYKAADLEKLGQVKELLYTKGFTLAGAKRYLQKREQEENQAQPGQEELFQPAPEQGCQSGQDNTGDRQDIVAELRDILRILS